MNWTILASAIVSSVSGLSMRLFSDKSPFCMGLFYGYPKKEGLESNIRALAR